MEFCLQEFECRNYNFTRSACFIFPSVRVGITELAVYCVWVLKAKAELRDSKRRSSEFMLESSNLKDSLVSEQNKRSEAESKVSMMTHELQEAAEEIKAKSTNLQKVCLKS